MRPCHRFWQQKLRKNSHGAYILATTMSIISIVIFIISIVISIIVSIVIIIIFISFKPDLSVKTFPLRTWCGLLKGTGQGNAVIKEIGKRLFLLKYSIIIMRKIILVAMII